MFDINVIERVIDKRSKRGATDESLIAWLEHLKKVWINCDREIDGLIDAIRQTPIN